MVAVAGVPSDPNRFYFGGVQGGIWRSTDYGTEWSNISDGKLPGTAQTSGALAVALSNPKVIYAGSGELDIRGDVDTGAGIYKTTDAGRTWHYAGLRETHTTAALAIDPSDPDTVYAAATGHVFKPNSERGIFNTISAVCKRQASKTGPVRGPFFMLAGISRISCSEDCNDLSMVSFGSALGHDPC